jgi:hypothetical protein
MRFYAPTRCIIVCLFMTIVVVHSQDLFDMFNDIKDQVAEKVDHASAKVKEKVKQHVLNLVYLTRQYFILLMKFHIIER